MLVFPNCKINLGLVVTGKREDGYHNIETVFYPVPLKDALEIISSANDSPAIEFTSSGIPFDDGQRNNLCIKAWQLLKQDFPQLPGVKIHLHKTVPIGAGLGGGSADAAFALTALNEKYALDLSTAQLSTYALQLGSDCPFFIVNQPCIATGRGEVLQPVYIDLSGYQLVLINPGIHINTQWAFSQIKIATNDLVSGNYPEASLQTALSEPVADWKKAVINDFEKPLFEKYPVIREVKEQLYEKGAVFASMSGSGSTVYGLFNKAVDPVFNFPGKYFIRNISL